ncbi:dienelactone hydrolase family protein [Phenylobacterium sp.]|uniref:dienelactone hydrolase family protein n=1 Tax=Phenylobacterium sp. TaxID=1871053 RepID=UPI0012185E54|nr:dienelactone hydrolase family protein [Phenylobacterium sp.]THD59716.1 MAG: dienelactone hydrolase family protein [Phenylobacterium sp.]
MKTEDIEYHADGARLVGTLFAGDEGASRRPGVLVAPEGGGLVDLTKTIARRLAEAGYVAFAMDYYGDGKPLTDRNAIMPKIEAFMAEPSAIRARAAEALAVLARQPQCDPSRLAAIGYCFGGTTVLELARSGADLKAVVGFHSGLATARPQDAAQIKAKVLTCIGALDPIIPAEQRLAFEREMTEGGVDWQMNLYGGAGHSFTNPNSGALGMPGFGYHAETDRRSWAAMLDLFDESLGSVSVPK